ncbi:hypothetical protein LTR37_011353 [Vermiconidia calcicola]|uniref:Uncharacterized protein n=1 Tax=Vermiconidia calcicola TaxID=1690605 RepID=A0ACC3N3F7_9PEZI|nr:hypothetical protein LTR37_011353 [Vermiconidia calcicola]
MDSRSLLDDDTTPTRDNPNIFDDEFEVEDFDVVADGFRNGQSHDREGGWRQEEEEGGLIRSTSPHHATSPAAEAGPSRNSTRKSRTNENPFESPDDEIDAPLERTPSGNFAPATAHRSVSSASSTQYAGTSSPRFGAGGPSHPYGMYPQGTVARTPSVATTSTARPSRQLTSRYAPGPQHPYALYPQGVEDDLDDEQDTAQNPVPVGFPGLGASYERRRGPDGEEQDFVGDYGHTEQLPPYTRYPEDGPEKMPLMGIPSPPTALHSRAPVMGTDPGMSLMHSQMQPVQQSMTDVSNMNRRTSTLSAGSGSPLNAVSSTQDTLLSKKSWKEKSWGEKRKTRFCGIPLLWIILGGVALIFIAALIGGSIGGFVEGQKKGERKAAVTVVSTSLYDASLITTATGTPPPTGSYPLTFGLPQETQAACLVNGVDQAAWSCDLAGEDQIWLKIYVPPGGNETGAALYTSGGNAAQLVYGAQTLSLNTVFAPFLPVMDQDDPEYGAASYFQQKYDKLVVIPENRINLKTKKIKRELEVPAGWVARQELATPGDKPWFCYWNGTFLEGFIYTSRAAVVHPTPTMSMSSSPTSTPPTTTGPSSTGSTPAPTGSSPPAHNPWSITWADPADIITTTIDLTSTTCTYSGAASGLPAYMHDRFAEMNISPSGVAELEEEEEGETHDPPEKSKRKRENPYDIPEDDIEDPLYQYLVKVEERRLQNSPPPMCVQYQVLNSGEWNWIPDADGHQITITLEEEDPPYSAYDDKKRSLHDKRTVPGGCHCQWMSGQ